MRAFRLSIVIVLIVGSVLVSASPAAVQQPREEFSAILSNISNAGGVGITPLTIRITRWTPKEENEKLLNSLRQKGQDAFLRELTRVDPVGSIATPTSLKYDFFYAAQQESERGRTIIMITDRPMSFAERWNAARSRDYPFTVIQMEIDKEGTGQGTLAQLAQLKLVGEFLGIENLATGPMKLSEIKKVK